MQLNQIRSRLMQVLWLLPLVWMIGAGGVALAIHAYGMQDQASEADVIVVLGAGLRRSGEPGWALTRRSVHAADLYKRGIAPRVICTGGQAPNRPRSEASACRDVLLRYGVPSDAILLEDRSRSTEENARNSQQIMQAGGLEKAVIVSDSYHLLRAHLIFSLEGIDAVTSPVPAELIRSRRFYAQSLVRELVALHWQVLKEVFNLPITYVAVL